MISYGRTMHEVDQALGKALGYPEYEPDMGAEPGDVCTGDHTPESLAGEAAGKILELKAELRVSQLNRNRLNQALDYIVHRAQQDDLTPAEMLKHLRDHAQDALDA